MVGMTKRDGDVRAGYLRWLMLPGGAELGKTGNLRRRINITEVRTKKTSILSGNNCQYVF
jgi:hypothetical protein